MDDLISRKAVIDKAITIPIAKIVTEDKVIYRRIVFVEDIENLPSAEPDNHEVACLLAELFGDTCACNFNDIDEWLPDKCEFLDACPNPGGVICWEQFLKHRAERRTDE